MPLSRAQADEFVGDIAELFSIRTPRISHCLGKRCRWKQKTLHLGRIITRDRLAHQLAHYVDRELGFPGAPLIPKSAFYKRKRGRRLHGNRFRAWERLIGNYIAQEFGEGEGVLL